MAKKLDGLPDELNGIPLGLKGWEGFQEKKIVTIDGFRSWRKAAEDKALRLHFGDPKAMRRASLRIASKSAPAGVGIDRVERVFGWLDRNGAGEKEESSGVPPSGSPPEPTTLPAVTTISFVRCEIQGKDDTGKLFARVFCVVHHCGQLKTWGIQAGPTPDSLGNEITDTPGRFSSEPASEERDMVIGWSRPLPMHARLFCEDQDGHRFYSDPFVLEEAGVSSGGADADVTIKHPPTPEVDTPAPPDQTEIVTGDMRAARAAVATLDDVERSLRSLHFDLMAMVDQGTGEVPADIAEKLAKLEIESAGAAARVTHMVKVFEAARVTWKDWKARCEIRRKACDEIACALRVSLKRRLVAHQDEEIKAGPFRPGLREEQDAVEFIQYSMVPTHILHDPKLFEHRPLRAFRAINKGIAERVAEQGPIPGIVVRRGRVTLEIR